MPGIAGLSDWLNKLVKSNPPTALPQPATAKPAPQTIQPGVPLPSYTPQNGGYSVQGLQPGASVFAQRQHAGVLLNPPQGPAFFDPTGRANDDNAHQWNTGAFMAVPMQQPQFEQFEMLQPMRIR